MKKIQILFLLSLFLVATLFSQNSQDFKTADYFNTQDRRTLWWESLNYDWKLAFNIILGQGRTTLKPNDDWIANLFNRDALYLFGLELKELSGLSNLTNLKNINAGYNKLVSLNGIQELDNLIKLKVNDNFLVSIDEVKNLTNLQEFRCEYNDITDISSIRGLTKLKRLNISNNFVTDISSLENLVLLEELIMGFNEVGSLSSLSKLKQLKFLRAEYNRIENLRGITALDKLENVYLTGNRLISLEGVQNLKKLKQFFYSANRDLSATEIGKVSSYFQQKKIRLYLLGVIFMFLAASVLIVVAFKKMHTRIKRLEKKRVLRQKIKEKLLDKPATFFNTEKRLLVWWSNLAKEWKKIFNIEMNNGETLFLPEFTHMRILLRKPSLVFKANTIVDLKGLNNLTRLKTLSFFNETPQFLALFDDTSALSNLKALSTINFSTQKIREIKGYKNLSEKYEINSPKSDLIYEKKGKIIQDLDRKCFFRYATAVLGNFEGIHVGHHKILSALQRRTKETSGEAVVISFSYHTMNTLHQQVEPYMILERDKKERIFFRKYKIHSIVYLDFTSQMKNTEPTEFIEKYLHKMLGIKEIFIGYDTRFGKDRKGDYKLLKSKGSELGIRSFVVPPQKIGNSIISSRLVRNLLKSGEIGLANKYLGRRYSIVGKVVKGSGFGRKLGFPTVNLEPLQKDKLIPKDGVYITTTRIHGRRYFCLTNIGKAPSVKQDKKRTIETYIYSYSSNLYSRRLDVVFLKRLRREVKFSSKKALKSQIGRDLSFLKKFIRVH